MDVSADDPIGAKWSARLGRYTIVWERRMKGARTPAERAQLVFSEPENRAYVAEYLKDIRQNFRDANSSLGRSITLIVLSMAIFELLARAAIAKASIGPFEIGDLTLVQRALPVIVAYLLYQTCSLFVTVYDFIKVHQELVEILHPDIRAYSLDYFLQPVSHSAIGPEHVGRYRAGRRYYDVMSDGMPALIVVATVAFEGYAAYTLLFRAHLRDVLTLLLLAVAAMLTCYGLYILLGRPAAATMAPS
jgi:hypothetical protein